MTGPVVRPALDSIPTYVPGRPAASAAQAYKLSSNENPYPPLPGVFEAAVEAAAAMNRYPDLGCADLLDGLSRRFGVPVDHLAVGTGSVAVLYHLLQALVSAGDEVVYAWRSFEAYPIAVVAAGGRPVQVPLDADARHDLDAMADAITDRTKAVIVCTPNNPTGPAVRGDELAAFIERVPSHVLVVIDEAYREFVRDEKTVDGVSLYRGRENVCVLRTFSKAYGLAGFRVGFAIAPPAIAAAIRKVALPFGVSHVAQRAALASLEVEDALLERVEQLVAQRLLVLSGLREGGWEVPDSEANFVWLPLGDRAVDFAAAAEKAGIMVRPFAGDGVRITIGEPEANDILLRVAAEFRST
ncbi:MAG: aminotransferase class I/II-fold pyridoxal phosphate-dependent enzyme [Propionibacteriales bacterium]|nr:aminotransferase class I/II-fold pyridoxal phosphate-dependent enzyme [Propionibacteriales bacterium]